MKAKTGGVRDRQKTPLNVPNDRPSGARPSASIANFLKTSDEIGVLLDHATSKIKDGSVSQNHCRQLLSLIRQRSRLWRRFYIHKKPVKGEDSRQLLAQVKALLREAKIKSRPARRIAT